MLLNCRRNDEACSEYRQELMNLLKKDLQIFPVGFRELGATALAVGYD